MDITLITEGTYPHHLGGVSVWCDQLLREVTDHRFNVLAISASGAEKKMYTPPPNVGRVDTVPLWAHTPRRKAGPVLSKRFRPIQEEFFRSLVVENNNGAFRRSLADAGQVRPRRPAERGDVHRRGGRNAPRFYTGRQ